MINAYRNEGGRLRGDTTSTSELAVPVWLDLVEPTKDEERLVEFALGIDAPTREEMEAIEVSSRPYHEGTTAVAGANGTRLLIVLLELQIDRLADVPERASREIHTPSREIFQHRDGRPAKSKYFQDILMDHRQRQVPSS